MARKRGRWSTTPPRTDHTKSTNIRIEQEDLNSFGLFFELKEPSKLLKNGDLVDIQVIGDEGEIYWHTFEIMKVGINHRIFVIEPVRLGSKEDTEDGQGQMEGGSTEDTGEAREAED